MELIEAVDPTLLSPKGELDGEGVLLLLRGGGDELILCSPQLVVSFYFFDGEGDLPHRLVRDLDLLLAGEDRLGRHICLPSFGLASSG